MLAMQLTCQRGLAVLGPLYDVGLGLPGRLPLLRSGLLGKDLAGVARLCRWGAFCQRDCSVIARYEAIHRRMHKDMDCHGAARLAMTDSAARLAGTDSAARLAGADSAARPVLREGRRLALTGSESSPRKVCRCEGFFGLSLAGLVEAQTRLSRKMPPRQSCRPSNDRQEAGFEN
jgi:hypothetical protein